MKITLITLLLILPCIFCNAEENDIALKTAAIEALGNIGEPSSIKVITPYIDNEEFLLKTTAIEALGKIATPQAFAILKNKLNSPNRRQNIQIAAILAQSSDVVAENIFNAGLTDKDPEIRIQALNTAKAMLLEKKVPVIIALLEDENENVRLEAIEAVSKLGPKNPSASEIIAKMVDDKNSQIRNAAVKALGLTANKKYIPIIKNRLSDESEMVKAQAELALVKLQGASERKKILQEQKEQRALAPTDKNNLNYRAGILISGELTDTSVIPELIEDLKNPKLSAYLKIAVINALKQLKEKLTQELKANFTKARQTNEYRDYTEIIFRIDGKTIPAFFIASLNDRNSPLHKDAPMILGNWGDSEAVAALITTLRKSEENKDYKTSVIYALGQLRDKSAAGPIEQYLLKK